MSCMQKFEVEPGLFLPYYEDGFLFFSNRSLFALVSQFWI
jgi:hypothetical protein